MSEVTPTDGLRERIREAAAEVWRDGLGGMTEADVLDRYADALLPVIAAAVVEVRAAALRESAGYVRSRSVDEWGASAACPSTVLCTVSDDLYRMAALDGTGEASC